MRMRPVLCLTAMALFACGCGHSEKPTAPPTDRIAPQVRLLFPLSREPLETMVSDSTELYVAACDSAPGGAHGRVAKVAFFYLSSGAAAPTRIGEAVTPISLQEIPDSSLRSQLNVPVGWGLYTKRWYTGPVPLPPVGTPIISGTRLRLFAVATDSAGNAEGTPDSLRVRVVNSCDDFCHGIPTFTVSPPTGRAGQEFTFDPSGTHDRIDSPAEIRVRWDFDMAAGDGWDIDWDADARADQVVRHVYAQPGIYMVAIETHNNYQPDVISRFMRSIVVEP